MNLILEKTETNKQLLLKAANVAWPAILESFFVALVALVDSFMVSGVGAYAVAAVGLTTQPKFVCLAVFIAINTSVSVLIARRKGQDERESANRILITAIICVLICVAIISTMAVVWADEIMHIMGSEPDTHDSAVAYFRIIIGFTIFNCISLVINAAQRGSGKTKIAMHTNITSNLVNVVFNYLLIHGNLGFPTLGIQGAAIATVFGTIVACGMSIASLFRKDSFVSVPYMLEKHLFATKRALKDITSFASNICVEQLVMRFGFLVSGILAANLGTQSMAAHQVGLNIMHLSFALGDGLQVAAVTLIGQSLGQGKPELAKKYGNICQGVGAFISICLSAIYLLFGEWIFQLYFPEDPPIVEIGIMITKFMVIVVLCQVSQVVFMGSLRGAGDVKFTTITSMLSVAFIRPGISYVTAYVMNLGILGIWIGIFADLLMRLILTGARFRSGKWMTKKI